MIPSFVGSNVEVVGTAPIVRGIHRAIISNSGKDDFKGIVEDDELVFNNKSFRNLPSTVKYTNPEAAKSWKSWSSKALPFHNLQYNNRSFQEYGFQEYSNFFPPNQFIPTTGFENIDINDTFFHKCFLKRMRQGFLVEKHCHGRFASSGLRSLITVDNGRTIHLINLETFNNNTLVNFHPPYSSESTSEMKNSSSNWLSKVKSKRLTAAFSQNTTTILNYYTASHDNTITSVSPLHAFLLSLSSPDSPNRRKKIKGVRTFRLHDVREIRHAWTVDPLKPSHISTAVMRKKANYQYSHWSFSLVFGKKKTIDLTCKSQDQTTILLYGLNLLRRRQIHKQEGRLSKMTVPLAKDSILSTDTDGIMTAESSCDKDKR